MSNQRLRLAVAAALGASVGAPMSAVFAQELEEIVVTATRRAQDLQEVPVSIVAITGDSLEMRGLQNLEDVGNAIPNINIQGGGNGTASTQFRVRGIPNVGTYIDGVWQVDTGGFLTQEFMDIDRVEVLRGPQGTSFGRDSLGGSIRIWTRQPSDEFGANVTATTGTLDRRDVKASVDLPISDTLHTKWTAASMYRDGYIQSLNIDQKNGGIDQEVYRGDILWTPTDRFSMRFIYSQNDMKFTEPRIQDGIFDTSANQGQAILLTQFYNLTPLLDDYSPENFQAGYPGGRVGQWENITDITLDNYIANEQTTVDINWDISDNVSVQFLTAYTEATNDIYNEWDNSSLQLVNDYNRSVTELFSEEIQFTGERGRISWVAGLYYWDQKGRARNMRYQIEEFAGGSNYPFRGPNDPLVYNAVTNPTGLYQNELGSPAYNPANLPGVVEGQHIDITALLNHPFCQSVRNGDGVGPTRDLVNCESVYISAIRGRYDNLSRSAQDGLAVFGGLTIALTDTLDLNLGARHHDQDNSNQNLAHIPGVTAPKPALGQAHAGGSLFAGTPAGVPLENSFDKVTWNVSLQKQFSDDIMGYVSASEGFDSGGISAPTIDGVRTLVPYDPQTLTNYEIGVRSDLADGKVRFNATLFHSIWEDIQNLGVVFDSRGIQLPTLVTTNVGEAQSQGVEVEMTFLPTDRLMFNVNLGYLDTEYTDIADGTFFLDETTEFQQAPEDTYNVGMQYTAPMSAGGTLTTRVDYSYTSQFWRSLPFLRMDAYSPPVPPSYDESGDLGTLNARITYEPPSADWSLSVFGTNLTDEYLLNSGFFHGIWGYDFATVARPREAGVTFNFRFD